MSDVDQPTLFDRPVARNTDPDTSHAAAASVERESLTDSRRRILELIRAHRDGLTDVQIAELYRGPPISPSGLRTRRSELVAYELVIDSGVRATLPSGRKAIVWTAVRPEERRL